MFRTELTITPQARQLPRTARILTVGSCFADSIGERLRQNKVQALVNPFGTVFQPLALAKLLRAAAGEEQDWQQHVVEARGRWQSYDFHSTLGADSPVELLQLIQQRVTQVRDFLRQTDLVVLTLGTAWAYRLRETDELVSNLHKLPATLFSKELLTADEVVNSLAEVHAVLRQVKPDIRIALTVSPVRHIKDTLPLNAVSKSVLRVACHYLSELLPGVSCFPAFELLNDELRDYRFYAADMLHPSEVAEDYVWEKFARTYFDADFSHFRKEWAAVQRSLTHRPLHLGAPEHRTFLDQTAQRLERLASQGVEVRQELRDVQRQLAALPPPRPVRQPELLFEDDGEERIDIGTDELAAPSPPLAATASSPDERTREGRGRNRRDRGRDRQHRAEQPKLDAEDVAPPELQADQPLAELVAAELPDIESVVDDLLEAAPGDDAAAYPAKKKKRRSRGGAKRTARKNAVRLAAEQALADPDNLPTDPETGAIDAGPAEELSLLANMVVDELTNETTPAEVAPDEPSEESQAPLVSDPLHVEETIEPIAEEPSAAERAAETPAANETLEVAATPRRRGPGPTPKKSKVITKSAQVKRPKRTNLFRNAAPAEAEPSAPATEAQPQAPIISTPIVPEALLERPVVAELIETPAALAATEPAPAKPRRGRSKAVPAPNEAAAEPNVPASEPPAPPRARRAAKPKAEGTDTPRRGRPPGRKTPPATDSPTA